MNLSCFKAYDIRGKLGSELNEEDEAVGIGLHRVRADGAFARQMFPQICREMESKRRHAASP